MGNGKFIPALLALLLISQLCFSAWTEQVSVSATDSVGTPVEGADVLITYQKSSAISGNDGKLTGKTNSEGKFTAVLSNTVNEASEIRDYKVKLSTYYWGGEEKRQAASGSGTAQSQFTVPFTLEKLVVAAYNSGSEPMQNVTVFLTEPRIRKYTGADGTAGFYVPTGILFSGFAAYENMTEYFSSDGAKAANGSKRINVTFSSSSMLQSGGASTAGKVVLQAEFLNNDGKPLLNQKVMLSYNEKKSSVLTGSHGDATLVLDRNGTINFTLYKYEYNYTFSANISVAPNASKKMAETFRLAPLLKIESFENIREQENCYWLSAKVSDPRTSLPIKVTMSKAIRPSESAAPVAFEVPVTVDQEGNYVSDVICIGTNTEFLINASNKYESAEQSIRVLPAQAKPVVLPGGNNQSNMTNITGKTEGMLKEDEALLSALILFLIIIITMAFVWHRKLINDMISLVLRSVIKYFREILKAFKLIK